MIGWHSAVRLQQTDRRNIYMCVLSSLLYSPADRVIISLAHMHTHTMFSKYTERFTIYCRSRRLVHSPDTRCQFIALYSNDVHRWPYRNGGGFSFFRSISLCSTFFTLIFISPWEKKSPSSNRNLSQPKSFLSGVKKSLR